MHQGSILKAAEQIIICSIQAYSPNHDVFVQPDDNNVYSIMVDEDRSYVNITNGVTSVSFQCSSVTHLKLNPNLCLIMHRSGDFVIYEANNNPEKHISTSYLQIHFESTNHNDEFIKYIKSSPSVILEHNEKPNDNLDCNAEIYFAYYGKLANQQNMLQDITRSDAYHQAIDQNHDDFHGKVVIDVGAGSGFLSFLASIAGATKVYAVEASKSAQVANSIVQNSNIFKDHIVVINETVQKIAETQIPERVDVIISEPLGTFLVNERMLETLIYARNRFLKPGGLMFPSKCYLAISLFSDSQLYKTINNKAAFWLRKDFYSIDLSPGYAVARRESFSQPIIDLIDPTKIVTPPAYKEFDLYTLSESDLREFQINYCFSFEEPTVVHGIASWFDALFIGTQSTTVLSTSPWSPPTHWYQIRFLFTTALAVNTGQLISGQLIAKVDDRQSYKLKAYARIENTSFEAVTEEIDLRDPECMYIPCWNQNISNS